MSTYFNTLENKNINNMGFETSSSHKRKAISENEEPNKAIKVISSTEVSENQQDKQAEKVNSFAVKNLNFNNFSGSNSNLEMPSETTPNNKRKAVVEDNEPNKVAKIASSSLENQENKISAQAERIAKKAVEKDQNILKTKNYAEFKRDIEKTLHFIKNMSNQTGFVKSSSACPFPILSVGGKKYFSLSQEKKERDLRGLKEFSLAKEFSIGVEINNEELVAFLSIKDAEKFFNQRQVNSLNIPNRQYITSEPKCEYHVKEKDLIIQIQDLYDGDLISLAKKEKWAFLKKIKVMQEAAKGVAEMHSNGYLHRDIKPDQFFKKDDKIVLADLDTVIETKTASDQKYKSSHFIGSPGYFTFDISSGPSQAIDMFAFGRSLDIFFDDISEKKERNAAEEELAKLIADLTNNEPKNRPSAEQTVERLKATEKNIASIPSSFSQDPDTVARKMDRLFALGNRENKTPEEEKELAKLIVDLGL